MWLSGTTPAEEAAGRAVDIARNAAQLLVKAIGGGREVVTSSHDQERSPVGRDTPTGVRQLTMRPEERREHHSGDRDGRTTGSIYAALKTYGDRASEDSAFRNLAGRFGSLFCALVAVLRQTREALIPFSLAIPRLTDILWGSGRPHVTSVSRP